jgi:hypothetical protein
MFMLEKNHFVFPKRGLVKSPAVRRVRDMLTYDTARAFGNGRDAVGEKFGVAYPTHPSLAKMRDGAFATVDSSGAFFVGELERLDLTAHEPLVAVFWSRDIDLRQDVSVGDDATSFTLTNFGSASGLGTGQGIGNGKAWLTRETTQVTSGSVDLVKIPHPLRPWGFEVKYTVFELEASARLGRPIDSQMYDAMRYKHQMDIDEQIFMGDTGFGDTGLLNNNLVTPTSFPLGVSGFTLWTQKTPNEILNDINFAVNTVWANSAWAWMPTHLLIPPAQFSYISTQLVSLAGNQSILSYVLENNVTVKQGATPLRIYPNKWCIGMGAGGTIGTIGTVDRLVAYTKNFNLVRYPMTSLGRTPVTYDGLWHKCVYFMKLGVVELVYPETMGYFDGL